MNPIFFLNTELEGPFDGGNMQKLTVSVPKNLNLDPSHAEFLLAIKLYETGNLNCEQAADMIGVSADDFMEILENFKKSIMKQRIQNLQNDINNI